jgi:hypothetical protein
MGWAECLRGAEETWQSRYSEAYRIPCVLYEVLFSSLRLLNSGLRSHQFGKCDSVELEILLYRSLSFLLLLSGT